MRTRTTRVSTASAVAALLTVGLAGSPGRPIAVDARSVSVLDHGLVLPAAAAATGAASPATATATVTATAATRASAASDPAATAAEAANANGFAFYPGRWHVKNTKLKERLKNSQEWTTSEATDIVRAVLDGRGVIAEYSETANGATYKGMSFYLYDPAAKQWTLFWADGRTGKMDPPLKGAFVNGRGEFHGDDQHEGRPVKIRFRWASTGADTATWEQAFSVDQGKTWETNWKMELTRTKK